MSTTGSIGGGTGASRHVDREDVKIPDPEPFTGDPKKARFFKVQATAKTKSPKYNAEEIKIRYVTNLLRDRAANWFVNYASLDGTYQFKTLKEFWQQFETQFVDQDPAGTAMSKIFDIKQGTRGVQAYLSEMYSLLVESKICEELASGDRSRRRRQYPWGDYEMG
ncbi:MAG: hypothetical protein M1816_002400, partial [Peltula sp. TS41687]